MKEDLQALEKNSVKLSIAGAVGMALLGFGFAALTDSQAIFMDGAFSFVNVIVGLLTFQVTKLVQQPEDHDFQFGYAHFEPLLNVFKGLFTLIICVIACIAAVDSLMNGGRELVPGWPVVYAVVAAIGCFALAFVMHRRAKRTHSEILNVEVKGWFIDGMISSIVALAFIAMGFVKQSQWAEYANYVDPALMIVLTVLLLPIPLKITKDNLLQLLWFAPDKTTQQAVKNALGEWLASQDTARHSLHMVKVGRMLYVQIRLLLPDSAGDITVREVDGLRTELNDAVALAYPHAIVDILFTVEPAFLAEREH